MEKSYKMQQKSFQGNLVNHTSYLADFFATSYNSFKKAKFVDRFCKKWQNNPSGNSHTLLNF
jgi:hypothetical protein